MTFLMNFIYFLYIFIYFYSSDRLGASRNSQTTLVLALFDISAIHHQTKMQSTKYKRYTVYIKRSAVKSACSAQTVTGQTRPDRVETPANRYGTGKTQEQSSEQMGSIGGEHNPGGKTKRDNPNAR